MTAPLQYLLINVKAIDLEKVSLCEMQNLKTVFNTLSAHDKYSLLNTDNLTQPIQMELSQKQKTFSGFFCAFVKSSLNFEYFQKINDRHSWCISEIMDSEKRG